MNIFDSRSNTGPDVTASCAESGIRTTMCGCECIVPISVEVAAAAYPSRQSQLHWTRNTSADWRAGSKEQDAMKRGFPQTPAVASSAAFVLALIFFLTALNDARAHMADDRSSGFNVGPRPMYTVAHPQAMATAKETSHVSPRIHNVRFSASKHPDAAGRTEGNIANSLPTGTPIAEDFGTSGLGKLDATNGTDLDSYVIVINAEAPVRVRQRYIKAQGSFTLDKLEPGEYRVLFATGTDWNSDEERFNRDASYFEFGRILSFQESRDAMATYYNHHSISINSAPHGNVVPKLLSEAEFHALSGKS